MLEFKPMELEDKKIIDPFFKEWKFGNSEFTFTNMYIWRKGWNIKYCVHDDILFFFAHHRSFRPFMFMPLTRKRTADICRPILLAKEFMERKGIRVLIRSATLEMCGLIEKNCPGQFNFTGNIDTRDYIYDAEKLRTLSGRKYNQKRNHINRFLSENSNAEFLILKKEHVKECMDMYHLWLSNKDGNMHDEQVAVFEALNSFEELGLTGCIVRIQNRIEAFSLGEKIRDDMALIHIEKANDQINGLYAYINRTFLQECWSDVAYVNREEDMGIAGLRKAKQSYHPIRFEEKYEVTLKDEV